MPSGLFYNGQTHEVVERELTTEEIALITETDQAKNERIQAEMRTLRLGAFQTESDPLYFAWQRGETTEEAWLEKVAEIRARFPYPA